MKRLSIPALLILMIVSFAASRAVAQEAAVQPPQIDAGWNLISMPCDVTVSDILEKTGIKSFQAYEWDGAAYKKVDKLLRGIGYAVTSNSAVGAAGLCSEKDDTSRREIAVREGFNMLGNPYKKAVVISDLLGDNAPNVINILFQLKHGFYVPITKEDKVQPWRAVWMFAIKPFSIYHYYTCDKLQLSFDTPATSGTDRRRADTKSKTGTSDSVFTVGDTVPMLAVCYNNNQPSDVKCDVKWTSSVAEVLTSTDVCGKFTAAKDGKTSVYVKYGNTNSNTLTVTVKKPVVLQSVKIYAESTLLYPEKKTIIKAYGIYSDNSVDDLPGKAELTLSDTEVGSLDGDTFTALKVGKTDVSATYKEIKSNVVTINVVEQPKLVSIKLYISPPTYFYPESKTAMYLTGTLSNGSSMELSHSATYTLSVPEVGTVDEEHIFKALKVGKTEVTATYKEFTSNAVTVNVSEPPTLVSIKLTSRKSEIYPGNTTYLKVVGTYTNFTEDLSDYSTYTVSDPEIGTVDDNYFLGRKAGKTDVTATYKGVTSNAVTINVIAVPTLVSITLTAGKTELYPGMSTSLYVTGKYSDGSINRFWESPEYTLSDKDVGSISDDYFYAKQAGTTVVTAVLGELTSNPVTFTVMELPPKPDPSQLYLYASPNTIEIHEHSRLVVYLKYPADPTTGYKWPDQTVTDQVEWVYDAADGRIESGNFYPAKLSNVAIKAKLGNLVSNTVYVSVIKKSLINLWIASERGGNVKELPCSDIGCDGNSYIRLGQNGKYNAIGAYENFDSFSLTDKIEKWMSSDESVFTVEPGGIVRTHSTGIAGIRAYYDGLWSEWSWISVVDDSTKDFLLLGFYNRDTIAKVGRTIPMSAYYYSRTGTGAFSKQNVTSMSEWHLSNESVGSFDPSIGVLTTKAPGTTDIYATYKGLTSNSAELEAWQTTDVKYCNPAKINEARWTDNLSLALLSTDCDSYSAGSPVIVDFSAIRVTNERHYYDVCLDLFILDSAGNVVKTFRNTDCSPSALSRTVNGASPAYEYAATWDQTDDAGNRVPPGEYSATARFYLTYCPVIKVKFTIN